MISMPCSLFAVKENSVDIVRGMTFATACSERFQQNESRAIPTPTYNALFRQSHSHSKAVTRVKRQNHGMRCNANAEAERQGGGGLPCCMEIALAKNVATDIGSPQPRADDRAHSQVSPHLQHWELRVGLVVRDVLLTETSKHHIASVQSGSSQASCWCPDVFETRFTSNTSKLMESAPESINVLEQEKS